MATHFMATQPTGACQRVSHSRLRRGALDGADHSGLFSKCCSKQPSGVGVAAIVVGTATPRSTPPDIRDSSLDGGCRMAHLLPAGLGVHHSAHGPSPYGASHAEQLRMPATRSSWDFQHLPTGASGPRPCRPIAHADLRRRPDRRRRYPNSVTGSVRSRPGKPYDRPACSGWAETHG
jgi:hypothetical protein